MKKILIWDNDGTIMGQKNPNDNSCKAKTILPGVADTMQDADYNFVISGFKSKESEAQNFDPEKIITRLIELMKYLPINAALFSPTIGGICCYAIIKKTNGNIIIKKIHENPVYKEYIGKFKKPDIGMFVALRDIAKEEFNQLINNDNCKMIGDTWHDKEAAESFGIDFIEANFIHN